MVRISNKPASSIWKGARSWDGVPQLRRQISPLGEVLSELN